MSETAERCDAWIERVLGLPLTAQARARLEEEEAFTAGSIDQADGEEDLFGEGYKAFDQRTVHANLTAALSENRLATATEWEGAAQQLNEEERKNLILARDAMKQRLAGLGNARAGEKPLAEAYERLTLSAKSIAAAQKNMTGFTRQSPLLVALAAAVPNAEYDNAIALAEKKYDALTKMHGELKKIKLPTQEEKTALISVARWSNYWNAVKIGLQTAKNTAKPQFDPATVTSPVGTPGLGNLLTDVNKKKVTAKKALTLYRDQNIAPIEKDMAACLTLLDSPRNNPEREDVGGALTALDEINTSIIGEPTQQDIARKAKALHDLEKLLFAWNDRRTRQHLPPCAEAVALADMLQAEHRKLIDHVVEKRLPLPVTNPDALEPEEAEALQKTWERLREGTGNLKIATGIDPTSKQTNANKNPAEVKQFRSETLANFARLLATPSGRKLVTELEKSGKDIKFEAGDKASCAAAGARESRPKLGPVKSEQEARAKRGGGTGSTVFLVRGAKDSDVALNTQSGGPLHSPRFIAMGHEMVHALHNARGINRLDVTLTEDPMWNNSEELRTIRLGKLSEQTLRAQYGLSAERFGHKRTNPGGDVAASYAAELDALDMAEAGPDYKFPDFERWPPRLRKAVAAAQPLEGPLPSGWDAIQLNVDQIRLIVKEKLTPGLKALGWSPLEMAPPGAGDRLDEVVRTQRAHPRSPRGLRYRSLGGDLALTALGTFQTGTGVAVATWQDASWPSKLAALEAAEAWLLAFGKAKGGEFQTIAGTGKLTLKLGTMAEAMKKAGIKSDDKAAQDAQSFAAQGGPAAIKAIRQLNAAIGTGLPAPDATVTEMLAAIGKVKRWLDTLATEIDKSPRSGGNELTAILSSSIRGGGMLQEVLADVVMCFRRGRAANGTFLAEAVTQANTVL